MIKPNTPMSEKTASAQAAAWFARQRVNPLSEGEAAEFEAWLKAEPSHTQAWSEFERLWARVDDARDDPRILRIREDARQRAAERPRVGRRWRIATAMAASVILGVAVWLTVRAPGVAPDWASIIDRASIPIGTGTGMIREASTQVGERSLLVLADGSRVTLNTASSVRADYSGPERRLTLLRGEAFFDVAKDSSRPFVVTAGSRQVIAVGTAFNVRLQDERVRVTLVEGKVRVVPAQPAVAGAGAEVSTGPSVTLVAGSALVAEADGAEHVERLDAERATSWRSGKLVFEGERLADVVAEMNRYSHETLEIADPALGDRKVSGVFEPTEGHAFARALEAYGIARTTEETASKIVLRTP